MSQATVNDEPGQAYAGKVHLSGQFPSSALSRLASELIYFGKLVSPLSTGDLTVGDQSVKLPTSAADILLAAQGGGISQADPSVERTKTAGVLDNFGAFLDESSLPVMRKGQIWVEVEAEVTDLSAGVFVRFQNAGTIPEAALGSLTPTNTADHEPAPEGMVWVGAVTVGSQNFGLLSVNLPG